MNTIGVLTASGALAAFVWGVTGSPRWAAAVAGVVGFVMAMLLLIDLDGDGGGQ